MAQRTEPREDNNYQRILDELRKASKPLLSGVLDECYWLCKDAEFRSDAKGQNIYEHYDALDAFFASQNTITLGYFDTFNRRLNMCQPRS